MSAFLYACVCNAHAALTIEHICTCSAGRHVASACHALPVDVDVNLPCVHTSNHIDHSCMHAHAHEHCACDAAGNSFK